MCDDVRLPIAYLMIWTKPVEQDKQSVMNVLADANMNLTEPQKELYVGILS